MAGSSFWIFIVFLSIFSVSANRPRGRILGGSESAPHLRPYMASLQEGGKHLCGGFLIAARWVLSAAHCLEETKNGTLQVLLGAHSLSEAAPNKRLYGIHQLFPHPGSSENTNHDDLLLIQLAEPAVLGPHVQILAYQTVNNDVPANTRCEVAGWGIISNTGKKPDRLQFVQLGIIARNQCNMRRYHDGTVTENMMCAESKKKDSCKGDSGGPIVCNGIAEGIVTTGSTVCGNVKKPGIYTRTAPYVSWITSTIAANN
ncbi:complement factor D [Protobothrops mucrosquamatus]|uniref:complement factor D n=1 Tax=Protobothrops mucrosquamatus TaxID=103944 RepID=UPI000775D8FC|nr:complement factor D [Protobothrops mucrosquamatus]